MGNRHCPDDNAPVAPARQPFGIAVAGGPAVVIDIAGTRLVTDPGLGPPGDYGFIRETIWPAVLPSCSGTPASSYPPTTVTEVPLNPGLPPAVMAKRLFEEQPDRK